MTSTRVVHVTQPVDAGVGRVVQDLLQDQREAGWAVHLISPDGGVAEWARDAGIPWAQWRAGREPGPSVLSEAAALRRLVAAARPDLVHLHSSKAGLAGRLALRGATPTVFQPHAWSFAAATGQKARAALRWERFGHRWTDLLVCCSVEEEREGADNGIRGRSLVVPNGVDVDRYAYADTTQRDAARNVLSIAQGIPVAVCVGRLSQQKGQDVAVQAWELVRRELPDAVLLLVGEGPERQRLESTATDGIQLLGHRADVPQLLAAADLIVLPSRWEGLALALLEGMATGRSVVATAVAGSRSTLMGGGLPTAGAVVAVDDSAALARAVVERLSDPTLAAAEGRAGRQRVEQNHDLRHTTQRIRAAYDRLQAG